MKIFFFCLFRKVEGYFVNFPIYIMGLTFHPYMLILRLSNSMSRTLIRSPHPTKTLTPETLRETNRRKMLRYAGNLKFNRISSILNDHVSHFPSPALEHSSRAQITIIICFSSSKSTKSTITKTEDSKISAFAC